MKKPDDGKNALPTELEFFAQNAQRDVVVEDGVHEQAGAQRLLLDALGQHLFDAVRVAEQVPNLKNIIFWNKIRKCVLQFEMF